MSSKKDDKDAIALTVGTEENKDNDISDSKGKKKKGKGKGEDPDEMSDEDKALKEGLELAVNRIKEPVNLFIYLFYIIILLPLLLLCFYNRMQNLV